MDSHFFILYKMPRSGSSRLGQLVNEHPECYCVNEILNDCDDVSQAQQVIDSQLRGARERNVGFTLNPAKVNLSLEFFDPRVCFGDRRLVLYCLTRGNMLEQCVSSYVTKLLQIWPGSKREESANRVLELVKHGLTLEEDQFVAQYKYLSNSTKELKRFASEYAKAKKVPLQEIQYEGLYGKDNRDLKTFFAALGIHEGIPKLSAGEKILPAPESYITNWDEIRAKIPSNERRWWSFRG